MANEKKNQELEQEFITAEIEDAEQAISADSKKKRTKKVVKEEANGKVKFTGKLDEKMIASLPAAPIILAISSIVLWQAIRFSFESISVP